MAQHIGTSDDRRDDEDSPPHRRSDSGASASGLPRFTFPRVDVDAKPPPDTKTPPDPKPEPASGDPVPTARPESRRVPVTGRSSASGKKRASDSSGKKSDARGTDSPKKSGARGTGVPPSRQPIVPVLRTYEGDSLHIAKTKGGSELRVLLAREAEKKRKAREDYAARAKDVLKDSAVLKDRQRNFLQKKKERSAAKQPDPAPDDRQSISDSVVGAVNYMQSVTAPGDGKQGSVTQGSVTRDPVADRTLTDVEREALREKQAESVEKESIREAWKGFQAKKDALREKGLETRDIRSYGADPIPNRTLRRQNIFAVLAIAALVIGLLIVITLISTRSVNVTGIVPPEISRSVPDVVANESQIFVDMTTSPEDWEQISRSQGSHRIIKKFVPYEITEAGNTQISLDSLFHSFSADVPEGLLKSFGEYYFIGNYRTKTTVNAFLIVFVENFGDALVWMRAWERQAPAALSSLFPNLLASPDPRDVTPRTKVIDNKDVRILTSGQGRPLLYYFFNRSVLVFVVGEETIPTINARIRSANSL